MGEAKRRKKLDPNYGKSSLQVMLKLDLELPVQLQQVSQALLKEDECFVTGIILKEGKNYPTIFVPYTREYPRDTKLYVHAIFSQDNNPELPQKVMDWICSQACLQLVENRNNPDYADIWKAIVSKYLSSNKIYLSDT